MSKSILRHLHITDWALRSPTLLPYAPSRTEEASTAAICWVVGEPPSWLADLCRVIDVAEYRHVAALPESIASQDWILWSGSKQDGTTHPQQLVYEPTVANAKRQLWHQICQYEY